MLIENVEVYGLPESVKRSKYPMVTDPSQCTEDITNTTVRLAQCETGEGHDNFLNGIIVQFDLSFTIKAWVEAERYHFFDFVSSMSTMHCISKMDIAAFCNEYVMPSIIAEVQRLKDVYLVTKDAEDYLRLLYNVPTGFRLTAGMTTNYRQLKTIYQQRKNHRLPEWREFCKWVESLPHSEFITGEE